MAQVIWNKLAQQEWRNKLLYGLSEFGESTAINFVHQTNIIVDNISKNPKSGFLEPILRHRLKDYRAHYIVGPIKLIYYYVKSSDTVRIVDVWDSRREPSKLKRRIR